MTNGHDVEHQINLTVLRQRLDHWRAQRSLAGDLGCAALYDEAMRWIKRYELEIATLQEPPQLELQPRAAVG